MNTRQYKVSWQTVDVINAMYNCVVESSQVCWDGLSYQGVGHQERKPVISMNQSQLFLVNRHIFY